MECLPDDILRQIFNYLLPTQLLHGFYGLNIRLNSLLFEPSRTYSIDFPLSSRENLQSFMNEYINLIDDQIVRVNINGESPNYFRFLEIAVNDGILLRFSRLKSLKLESVMDEYHVRTVIYELKNSPTLENLEFSNCVFPSDYVEMTEALNEIWNLSKLSRCSLKVIIRDEVSFISPTTSSQSISHLKLAVNNMDVNEFSVLLENTPNLRYFDFQIDSSISFLTPIQTRNGIDRLKLSFVTDRIDSLLNLCSGFSNLRELTIEIIELSLDGNQWQDIIKSCFKHLEKFRLKQIGIIQNNESGEEIIDQLLNSFKTSFWMYEHRWFIQIDWFLSDECSYIYVYTLPYAFPQINLKQLLLSKKTSPGTDQIIPSRQVRQLDIDEDKLLTLESCLSVFPNLQYIRIDSISNLDSLRFLSCLPFFITLEISISDSLTNGNHMDSLIRLNSCIIHSSSFMCTLAFLETVDIYAVQLNLQVDEQFYNEDQCHQLIETFALRHCQYLTIDIQSIRSLTYFLGNLHNLQMITIQVPQEYISLDTIEHQLADVIDNCSNRNSYRFEVNHDNWNPNKIHIDMN